jgi:hypothetical protein
MISAAGLGLNPFQQARLLAMRRRTGPPAKVGFWRPRLAPPPPPPPPPALKGLFQAQLEASEIIRASAA